MITGDITRRIRSLNKSIAQVSKGDLTTKLDMGRNDEFFTLCGRIFDMMEHMRTLIGEVQEVRYCKWFCGKAAPAPLVNAGCHQGYIRSH